MSDMVDVSPDTHFLESIRAQPAQYPVLLGEAVDNSFDAGARNVSILIDENAIEIVDDGIGVTRDRWQGLVKLGSHMPTTRTALGRYGVGIKYQAISAGNMLSVISRSVRDGEMRLRVNWAEMLRAGSWSIQAPIWLPAPGKQTGTTVRITALERAPRKAELDKARSEIALMFGPALSAGSRIVFNGEDISAVPDPELKGMKNTVVYVSPGKGARILAGMLRDPKDKIQGVQLVYKHRVLRAKSAFGCRTFSTSGMFARVELVGNWKLKTFKDGIHDPDDDQLEDLVHEVLLPLLEQCVSTSMEADVAFMRDELNALLPPELAARARPKATNPQGRQGEKKGQTGVVRDAPIVEDGPARSVKPPRNSVMIDFVPGSDEDGYGRFESGRPSRIFLAKDNPHIAQLLRQRDKVSAKRELYLIAMAIYLNAQPLELPFDGSFGLRYWRLIERQNVSDEEAAAA